METRTVVGKGSTIGWAAETVQIAPVNSRTAAALSLPVEVRPERPSHLIAGLSLLLRAFDYATDIGVDVWDFAIEISELRSAGMTTSDFRWLVSKGFVQHGQETSLYGAPHRCFHRGEGLTFLATSALVLTSRGATELRRLLVAAQSDLLRAAAHAAAAIHSLVAEPDSPHQPARDFVPRKPGEEETVTARSQRLPLDLKPAWEARCRELRVGELLVKKFRVPAGNQELVLSAFEEEGWPAYIDDPLPMKSEIAPKQRMHNVITRLNGSQLALILHFHGNGNGNAIGWQLLPANSCL
ncbi:MAG: hypothetical protein ACLP9L_12735 [Thermoguttaceae bacterium]